MLSDLPPAVRSALNTIDVEQAALSSLGEALSNGLRRPFVEAVEIIRGITEGGGRVIVSGMGKSGHIGTKIAATLASTGTPAFFVHPGEASHGDLGMVTARDAILALSWSGETAELRNLVDYASRFQLPLFAVTSAAGSTLARASDVTLLIPKSEEACPHGLAPTTSAIMQLALGDALAISLLESKGFSPQDFKIFHPGGQLGANLQFVSNLMHKGDELPIVSLGTHLSDAIAVISDKGFGCVVVVDRQGALAGIVTDGDLRRGFGMDLAGRNVEDIMTPSPIYVAPDTMVSKGIELLNSHNITVMIVADADRRPVGIVHMHDLLRAGVA